MKLILIPLKKFCTTTSEVTSLVNKVFNDIKQGKDLDDFRISREIKKSKSFGRAMADAIILEPNFNGIGFSFNKMIKYFKEK